MLNRISRFATFFRARTLANAAYANTLALKPQVRESRPCFMRSNHRKTGKSVRGRTSSSQTGGVTSAQACGRFPSRRRPWLSSAHRAAGRPRHPRPRHPRPRRQPEHRPNQAKQKTGRTKRPDPIVHGAPDTIRTYDTRFRRAVLYPLSY